MLPVMLGFFGRERDSMVKIKVPFALLSFNNLLI